MKLAGWAALLTGSMVLAVPAWAVDWAKVPGKEITLLYPAHLSWEMLLTQSEHSGADKFREGKNCRQCHESHEAESGGLLVADKSSEPSPIAGKPGALKAIVKTARDDERIFLQVAFNSTGQPDAKMDPDHLAKVSVMFDDGHVTELARGGCWGVCHDNLARMPSAGNADTTKYLARSRVKMSRTGGDQIKPDADLAAFRTSGAYVEYWQARIAPNGTVTALDGSILEKRTESATPAVTATATQAGSVWTVTLSRKLKAGAPYKDFVPGTTYNMGISVHAGHTAQRFHYVSLEKTLVLDQGTADFVAARN